ncbi:polyhydroxyalkanoate granule-associated phasin [Ottowia sp.]|uniref:polyhydroxyalkanoate granule-associated phasin n=1 Tax=Ottowia sp. TaxID=1898956 RepID=UPI002D0D827D|nr:polyhydroxyalkanoate granule-associated phasin [Ottowia sp.]HOB65813.1 hypothetical protein [Ottowia sp.]HPZ57122.1 hypothetical protein [Ottowia sp.]HQD46823.1 hypothetical protein [Ottowia sp.]
MVTGKQRRLGRDTAQMAAAVPQVIAHRVGRMMGAGMLPSGRDQQEFYLMGAEKVAAFQESWAAMSWQALAAQQQFAAWWMQAWWKVALGGWMNPPSLQQLSSSAQQRLLASMFDVAHQGMTPVRRRAVANARRLGRAAR